MRNKKLRNTLLALALTPFFAFSATGCWKATTDDELSEVNQTEAYSVLRSLTLKDNFLVDSGSNEVKVLYNDNYKETTNWSNSSIPEEKREYFSDRLYVPLESESEEYKSTYDYGYNYEDNTGYDIHKNCENNNNENNNKPLELCCMEFTKNTQQGYLKYCYDSSYKNIYKVDEHYAENYYREVAFEDIYLYPFFDGLKEYKSLDSLKQNINEFAYNILDWESYTPEDKSAVETTFDITISNGNYSLIITASVKDVIYDEDIYINNSKVTMTLVFNENNIETIDTKWENTLTETTMLKDYLGESYNDVTFDDDDYISVLVSNNFSLSCDLVNPFNSANINQDTTGYTGTGTNNEILGNRVHLNFRFVDFECGFNNAPSFTYGDTLNLNNNSAYYFTSDHVTKSYYWDKECTIPVQSSDTAPSYETNIYVKLNVEEGYSAVATKRIYVYDNDSTYFFNDKVINISTEKYVIYTNLNTDKVYYNGVEITDYKDGITLTKDGINIIEVYTEYSK